MKTTANKAGAARLAQMIRQEMMSTNFFACEIGIARGEVLYRILREEDPITPEIAARIHDRFPHYAEAWILGETAEA